MATTALLYVSLEETFYTMAHSENRHPIAFHREVRVLLWFVRFIVLWTMVNSIDVRPKPRIHSPTVGIVFHIVYKHPIVFHIVYIHGVYYIV